LSNLVKEPSVKKEQSPALRRISVQNGIIPQLDLLNFKGVVKTHKLVECGRLSASLFRRRMTFWNLFPLITLSTYQKRNGSRESYCGKE
jgi:hypothetical protein